jgi:hypothetical protein
MPSRGPAPAAPAPAAPAASAAAGGPGEAAVRAAAFRLVSSGDLGTLTRRAVLEALARQFPGLDPEAHRAAVAEEIQRALAARG